VTLPKRGEVWSIEFEPSVGAEIRKIRPGVVVSMSKRGHLPLRMVVPITEWKPWCAEFGWFERIAPTKRNGLSKESAADCFQCKSLSLHRFVRKLGMLTEEQMEEIVNRVLFCIT
jgi:mRNA interferase MazF